MTDNYQGDPKIYITSDGATMKFTGGQPRMDKGLENLVILTWFSREWYGNVFLKDENQKLNGKFELANEKPVTVSSLKDIEKAASKDTDYLISSGVMSQIEIETVNTDDNQVTTNAVFAPPGADLFTIVATKHGKNWIAQANDPAYLKE